MATRVGSHKQSEGTGYDIHVLGFDGEPTRTRDGLCELFGVDVATAERVLAAVPGIVQRGVSANDAERCALALRSLGARVVLEPVVDATIERPIAPVRPAPRRETADLEFDVLSALDAALEPSAMTEPPLRDLGQELSLEESLSPSPVPAPAPRLPEVRVDAHVHGQPAVPSPRWGTLHGRVVAHEVVQAAAVAAAAQAQASQAQSRREELDLESEDAPVEAMLELDAVRSKRAAPPTAAEPAQRQSRVAEQRVSTTQVSSVAKRPGAPQRPPSAQGQMSAAALPVRPVLSAKPQRDRALAQLLVALAVAAIGHWVDSSPFYGSAGIVSVIAHGLALQQLLLGVRTLVTV